MVMTSYKPEENISSLHRSALIRWPTVKRIIPVSKSTWDSGVEDGRYPKGIRISTRGIAWQLGTILDLADELAKDIRQ